MWYEFLKVALYTFNITEMNFDDVSCRILVNTKKNWHFLVFKIRNKVGKLSMSLEILENMKKIWNLDEGMKNLNGTLNLETFLEFIMV